MSRRRTCPTCGAATVAIVYGMPDPNLIGRMERGDIELGGCVIGIDDPDRVCRGPERHFWRQGQDGPVACLRP